MILKNLALIAVIAPLIGSVVTGLIGRKMNRTLAHTLTIVLVACSLACALWILNIVVFHGQSWHGEIYRWGDSGSFHFHVGFLVDRLASVMLVIVTFVSLLVHIYSIGYMKGDDGYNRFFSYMSLFTFAMLMLVLGDNFLVLFFGWEGVGLVSYLLIGFWFQKPTAADGSYKAFIVNRVGDFGFILGIAAILDFTGSIDYSVVFGQASALATQSMHIWPNGHWNVLATICVLLFVGAMGKSAQVPLHVWLPESMEGPTPISALIHAATMVTAGVYMVARMSPLFALSPGASSMVLIIGATGALFLGILAFVEFDIKRVIAYSTMSQLGYMMAADGIMAYPAAIFHLMTHACFKALLFLSAGSVIIAMHHEQDMRKMGNLRKYLPWTYAAFLVGSLALAAIPPFAGFYSKDPIIDAVGLSNLPGAGYAYWCLLIGGFVTGYYIFRAFFMTFHTKEKMSEEVRSHLKETPWSMRFALIMLAIPSIILGFFVAKDFLYATPTVFGDTVAQPTATNTLAILATHFHGAFDAVIDAFTTVPFWFAIAGVVFAWFNVIVRPAFPAWLQRNCPWLHRILIEQFGFDLLYINVLSRGVGRASRFFYEITDLKVVDSGVVEGSGRFVTRVAQIVRRFQSGYLYHYVLVMVLGVVAFTVWLLLR